MDAIEHLREASRRLRLLEEQANGLERSVRSAEEKTAEQRLAAERKVTSAEARALETERRAEALEARAAEADRQVELLSGVIWEELGGTMPTPFKRGRDQRT